MTHEHILLTAHLAGEIPRALVYITHFLALGSVQSHIYHTNHKNLSYITSAKLGTFTQTLHVAADTYPILKAKTSPSLHVFHEGLCISMQILCVRNNSMECVKQTAQGGMFCMAQRCFVCSYLYVCGAMWLLLFLAA